MAQVEKPELGGVPVNPLDPEAGLKAPSAGSVREEAHPPQAPYPEDSSTTKAEKLERHGLAAEGSGAEGFEQSPAKRIKLDQENAVEPAGIKANADARQKGVAPIKPE